MVIQSLLYLIASLTVFLILTEILTIDISYGKQMIIDFDLMIFGIRFTQSKKKNKKGRKKRFRPDFYTLTSTVKTLISKSEVTVHRIAVSYPYKSPSENAIKIGLFNSLLSSALAYTEANSKKFRLGNITFEDSANNNYKIALDLSLKLSLISFLGTFLKLRLRGVRKV